MMFAEKSSIHTTPCYILGEYVCMLLLITLKSILYFSKQYKLKKVILIFYIKKNLNKSKLPSISYFLMIWTFLPYLVIGWRFPYLVCFATELCFVEVGDGLGLEAAHAHKCPLSADWAMEKESTHPLFLCKLIMDR